MRDPAELHSREKFQRRENYLRPPMNSFLQHLRVEASSCVRASLVLRRGFGSGSSLVTSSTVNKAKSASLANKALLCRSSSPNRTLFGYLSSFNFCRALYYDRALQIVSYTSFWSRKVSPNLKNFLCNRFVVFQAVSTNSSQFVVSRKHIS